ncbi:Prephenate dehydratase [Zostera marina]|uniref:Prephenate dehydratase n=1 Tax=Zostera marina TaxID=29655 RepID=A0A0K9NK47_ZOSMR|nr:Prephenate dehydratase [Zostera marina]
MALQAVASTYPTPSSTHRYKKPRTLTHHHISIKNKSRSDPIRVDAPPQISSPFHLTSEELESIINQNLTISTLEHLFSLSPSNPLPPSKTSPPSSPRRRPPVRVAYQGVRGSYCQEAATRSFSSASTSISSLLIPCGSTLESPFSALELGEADRAVVPVENSFDGPIPRNLDLLIRHSEEVKIIGEIVLPVNHCLLCLPGTNPSNIRRVVSHPQAISHCRQRLQSMENLESVEEVQNAAEFARFLADERTTDDTAVIGSEIAAEEFGLSILHSNFQDREGNYNRFLQLGRRSSFAYPSSVCTVGESWKTTVAFSLEKGASDLFKAMCAFENFGVKVCRVDHRPNRDEPMKVVKKAGSDVGVGYFNYVFVMDVEGREDEPAVRTAINQIKDISGFSSVLGSYAICESEVGSS